MKLNTRISDIAKFLSKNFEGKNYEINQVTSINTMIDESIVFSNSINIDKSIHKKVLILVPWNFEYDNNVLYSIIKVKNPRLAFAKVLTNFFMEKKDAIIDETVSIGKYTTILDNVSIGKYSVLGENVHIGKNTIIHNHVIIEDNTIIGDNCYIKSGAIIGEEGFGFDFEEDGTPIRIPHLGNVKIGENVEIGANTVIARGTLGSTIIKDDVKIDDQVFIAHNCIIGEKTMIIAFAQISGSVHIGKECWIAPNVSIIQKVHISDNVTIGIGAVVTKDVEKNKKIMGLEGLELRPLLKLKKRISYGE
jgi:UDP-3-O-[3-hydroxymyristoyl] glucosamine N-acyltransferase